MKAVRTRVLAALVASAAFGAPAAARAQERALDALVGTWELVEPARQKRLVRREVDRVIDQMSFLVRGIARDRAHREIRPAQEMALRTYGGGRVRLRFGRGRPEACRTDGRPRRAGGATVTCRVDGPKLVRRSARDDGSEVATFRLGPDGETLLVGVRITSPHLPDTIEYELIYRRAR